MKNVVASLLIAMGIFGVIMEFEFTLAWWGFIFVGLVYGIFAEEDS